MKITRTISISLTVDTTDWAEEYDLPGQAAAARDFTDHLKTNLPGIAEAFVKTWPAMDIARVDVKLNGFPEVHTRRI